jgi:hypothetical protein
MLIGVIPKKRSSIAASAAMVMATEKGEAKVTSLSAAPLLLLSNFKGWRAVLIVRDPARHRVVTHV